MKVRNAFKFLPLALILLSCGGTRFYHSDWEMPYWHSDAKHFEIRLHEDSTFEEFYYSGFNNGRSDCLYFDGNYHQKGDTIFVTGSRWSWNYIDSNWYVADSSAEMTRFLINGKTLTEHHLNDLNSVDTMYIFQTGKSRSLRKIERRNTLEWWNQGSSVNPYGKPTKHPGILAKP